MFLQSGTISAVFLGSAVCRANWGTCCAHG